MGRILFLTKSLSDYEQCRTLGQWILQLQCSGHSVHVFTLTDRDAHDALLPRCHLKVLLREARLDNPCIPMMVRFGIELVHMLLLLMLFLIPLPFFLPFYYDMVIADQGYFSLRILRRLDGCEKIVWIQNMEPDETSRHSKIYRDCDRILCDSKALQKAFFAHYFRSGRVQVLQIPRQALPVPKLLADCGGLSDHMLEILLSAVCRVKAQGYPCELYLLGRHPQEASLTTLLKISQAVFLPARRSEAFFLYGNLVIGPESCSEYELQAKICQLLTHPLLTAVQEVHSLEVPHYEIYHLPS